MVKVKKIYQLTDPAKPAKSLIIMLKIALLLSLASVLSGINELSVLHKIKNQSYATQEALEAAANRSDTIETSIGYLQLLLALFIIITFIRWMYRAAANNQAWGIENITQKPHWGWINFIIPIWSLVKPYEFFKEIWNAVEYDKENPENWKKLAAPKCLKIWWACFIISNILGRAIFRLVKKAETVDEIINLNHICLLNEFIDIAENLALIMLVAGIMTRQMEYCRKKGPEQIILPETARETGN